MKKFFSTLLTILLIEAPSAVGINTSTVSIDENKAQTVLLKPDKNNEDKAKKEDSKIESDKEEVGADTNTENEKNAVGNKEAKPDKKVWLNKILVHMLSTVAKIIDYSIQALPYILIRLFG